MTDREMLLECFDAVRAMENARVANRFLNSKGANQWKAGAGPYKLRNWLLRRLENHFLEQRK